MKCGFSFSTRSFILFMRHVVTLRSAAFQSVSMLLTIITPPPPHHSYSSSSPLHQLSTSSLLLQSFRVIDHAHCLESHRQWAWSVILWHHVIGQSHGATGSVVVAQRLEKYIEKSKNCFENFMKMVEIC